MRILSMEVDCYFSEEDEERSLIEGEEITKLSDEPSKNTIILNNVQCFFPTYDISRTKIHFNGGGYLTIRMPYQEFKKKFYLEVNADKNDLFVTGPK